MALTVEKLLARYAVWECVICKENQPLARQVLQNSLNPNPPPHANTNDIHIALADAGAASLGSGCR